MKRFALFLGLVTFLVASCQNNQKREEQDIDPVEKTTDSLEQIAADTANRPFISATVQQFIQAYNTQNNQAVNELIHPEVGITVIHRPGAIDRFNKLDKFDFEDPVPSYYPYVTAEHAYTITYGAIPIFSCETESWNKQGLFVDDTEQPNRLMTIAEHEDKYEDIKVDAERRNHIEKAEKDSHRVVLTTDTPLVFYVKEIDGKWYVTVLDRAYGDCSA